MNNKEEAEQDAKEADVLESTEARAGVDKLGPSKAKNKATWFRVSQDQLNAILIVVILGLCFLAAGRFPLRLDLTAANIHTLSDVSKSLVSNLQNPLRIRVFLSPNLPAPLHDLETSIVDILSEYKEAANKNFSFALYPVNESDADLSPNLKKNLELAQSYGLTPQQIQTIEKDQVKLVNAYLSIVVEYGDLIERVNVLNSVEALEYSFSSVIERLSEKINSLVALKENISITVFMNNSFVEASPFFGIKDLETLPGLVEAVVGKINEQNYDRLEFSHREAITDGEKLQLQEKEGIEIYPWGEFQVSEKTFAADSGVAFIRIVSGDEERYIELLQAERALKITQQGLVQDIEYRVMGAERLEFLLDSTVESLLNLNRPLAYLNEADTFDLGLDPSRSGYAALQGAAAAPPEGTSFAALLAGRYKVDPVNFEDLDPRRYPSLLLLSPQRELSDWELFQIDSYVMGGGSLILFHDMFLEESQNFPGQLSAAQGIPRWQANPSGIEKLIEHYGLRIEPAIVMDKNSYVSQGQGAGAAQEQKIYFAPLIQNKNINNSISYLRGVRGFAVIAASPLTLQTDVLEKNEIETTLLFSSSEASWKTDGEVSLVPFLIEVPSDETSLTSYPLAYVLAGSFKSYFAGKEIPIRKDPSLENTAEQEATEAAPKQEKEIAETQENRQSFAGKTGGTFVERSPASTRIFVMGTSKMLGNNIIDQAGRQPNAILAQNIVDYISGEGSWALMRAKGQRVNPLDILRGDEAGTVSFFRRPTFIKTFNIIALPILAALLGLWMYFYRLGVASRIRLAFAGAGEPKRFSSSITKAATEENQQTENKNKDESSQI